MRVEYERFYRKNFPFISTDYEYGKWYVDFANVLYIHPCGYPLCMDLNDISKCNAYRIIKTIEAMVKNYPSFVTEVEDYDDIDTMYLSSDVKSDLYKLIKWKKQINKQTVTSFKDITTIAATLNLSAMNSLAELSILHPLVTPHGLYDSKYHRVSLYVLGKDGVDIKRIYSINIPKRKGDFEDTVYHVLNKPWCTREHISLMYSSHLYLNNKAYNLFTY